MQNPQLINDLLVLLRYLTCQKKVRPRCPGHFGAALALTSLISTRWHLGYAVGRFAIGCKLGCNMI